MPLYDRALAIDEKALGPDHPDVAGDLNNKAALLKAMVRCCVLLSVVLGLNNKALLLKAMVGC